MSKLLPESRHHKRGYLCLQQDARKTIRDNFALSARSRSVGLQLTPAAAFIMTFVNLLAKVSSRDSGILGASFRSSIRKAAFASLASVLSKSCVIKPANCTEHGVSGHRGPGPDESVYMLSERRFAIDSKNTSSCVRARFHPTQTSPPKRFLFVRP